MTRTQTTIRARDKWLDTMQELADELGTSRADAIQIAALVGARVLQKVTVTQEQFDTLVGLMKEERVTLTQDQVQKLLAERG
jgi:hypothetical protein